MSTNRFMPVKDAECSFCNEKIKANEGGQWHASPWVFCCPKCAVDALPKLIADSLTIDFDKYDYGCHPDNEENVLSEHLIEVEKVLVTALSIRALRNRSNLEWVVKLFKRQFVENHEDAS